MGNLDHQSMWLDLVCFPWYDLKYRFSFPSFTESNKLKQGLSNSLKPGAIFRIDGDEEIKCKCLASSLCVFMLSPNCPFLHTYVILNDERDCISQVYEWFRITSLTKANGKHLRRFDTKVLCFPFPLSWVLFSTPTRAPCVFMCFYLSMKEFMCFY